MAKQKTNVVNEDEAKEVTIRGPYFMSQAQLFAKLGLAWVAPADRELGK